MPPQTFPSSPFPAPHSPITIEIPSDHQELKCPKTSDPHHRRAAEDGEQRSTDHRFKGEGDELPEENRRDKEFFLHIVNYTIFTWLTVERTGQTGQTHCPSLPHHGTLSKLAPSISTSHPAQTVVGYQELDTEASGFKMVTPTFLKVNESNKVTLAELKVSGYTPPTWEKVGKVFVNVGGCAGQTFVMQTLTTSGSKDKQYVWLDYMTSATDRVGPGWFADANATPIEGGEGSVQLDAGGSLWISGSGLQLQPSGAVNPFDVEVETAQSGFKAIGNSMPVDLKLSDLTVSGYTPPTWEKVGKVFVNVGGCAGQTFVMQTLTTSGSKDKQYVWLDYMTSATDRVGPGWFADANATAIEGGADKVTIPAGYGLWISGSGLTLAIPAPEL